MRLKWKWLRAIFGRLQAAETQAQSDRHKRTADGGPVLEVKVSPTMFDAENAGTRNEPKTGEKPTREFRPLPLEAWETLAERRIREAQERGEFDNLRGAGKPLNLDRNPYAGEWELGFHLLKQAGYTLPWIELGKEIEADRVSLRVFLDRSSARLREMRGRAQAASERRGYDEERRRYRDQYLRMAAELDRKLAEYSAEVPTWRMDQGRIPPDLAVRQFDEACPPA